MTDQEMAEAGWRREKHLAIEINRPVSTLKSVRHGLTEGLHWKKIDGAVNWTPTGVTALLVALGMDAEIAKKTGVHAPAPELCGQDARVTTTAAQPAPFPKKATVTVKRLVKNQRILCCDHEGREVWMRVRDSALFRPGMVVKAVQAGPADYELDGRCPRSKSQARRMDLR